MEFYLLIIFVIIYISSLLVIKNKERVRKVWFLAFMAAFIASSVGILSMSMWNKELVVTISNMGWFYLTYICATAMVFLGIINFWIFRKIIWYTITGKPVAEDCVTDEEVEKAIEDSK